MIVLIGYGFVLEDNKHETATISAFSRDDASHSTTETAKPTLDPQDSLIVPVVENTLEMPLVLTEISTLRRISPEQGTAFNRILRGALSLTEAWNLALRLANRRELTVLKTSNALSTYLPSSPTRNAALMVDKTILALRDYLERLIEDTPKSEPQTARQKMASTFWIGQREILEGNIEQLESFLFGLQKRGYIITLSQILSNQFVSPDAIHLPLRALLENGLKVPPKAKHVIGNALLEFVFVMWFGLMWSRKVFEQDGELQNRFPELRQELVDWLQTIDRFYGTLLRRSAAQEQGPNQAETVIDEVDGELVAKYAQLLHRFATDETEPFASCFRGPVWNERSLAVIVYIFRQESVAFQSMDRLVFNGFEEVDEPFLFIEQQES